METVLKLYVKIFTTISNHKYNILPFNSWFSVDWIHSWVSNKNGCFLQNVFPPISLLFFFLVVSLYHHFNLQSLCSLSATYHKAQMATKDLTLIPRIFHFFLLI